MKKKEIRKPEQIEADIEKLNKELSKSIKHYKVEQLPRCMCGSVNCKPRYFNLGGGRDAFGGQHMCDTCCKDAMYEDLLD